MSARDILYEIRGPVGIATFNRPEALNAFRHATLERLLSILDRAAADDAVRVLVLTGSGRAFSAGIDLKELGGQPDRGESAADSRARLERAQDVTRKLVDHPKVVIAAVNGLAVGIGAELCVACDLRIAADAASFAFPEVKRALVETNGVTYLLPRIVGLGRAMQWLLTGETISAARAHAAGLVGDVVAASDLLDVAVRTADAVAASAPIPIRLVKRLLHGGYRTDLEGALHAEVEGMLTCMASADFREGVRAFLEKRQPAYRGS